MGETRFIAVRREGNHHGRDRRKVFHDRFGLLLKFRTLNGIGIYDRGWLARGDLRNLAGTRGIDRNRWRLTRSDKPLNRHFFAIGNALHRPYAIQVIRQRQFTMPDVRIIPQGARICGDIQPIVVDQFLQPSGDIHLRRIRAPGRRGDRQPAILRRRCAADGHPRPLVEELRLHLSGDLVGDHELLGRPGPARRRIAQTVADLKLQLSVFHHSLQLLFYVQVLAGCA